MIQTTRLFTTLEPIDVAGSFLQNSLILSEHPAQFESEEAISAVVRVQQDAPPESVHAPLDASMLMLPIDDRLDAMLARLHARDFLGAYALAESVLASGDHGLAQICRKEALAALTGTLEGPLARGHASAPLSGDAEVFLKHVDEHKTAMSIISAANDRALAICAFHELVQSGAVIPTRADGHAHTVPAPSSK
jgi:hypothetical protein